jgi:hypothetical protein
VTLERGESANVPVGGPPRSRGAGNTAATNTAATNTAATGDGPTGATTTAIVWVDGRQVDAADAHLSALDRGFTLADGLFESLRCYAGSIFRQAQHLDRLRRGAAALGIALPAQLEAMVGDALTPPAEPGCATPPCA